LAFDAQGRLNSVTNNGISANGLSGQTSNQVTVSTGATTSTSYAGLSVDGGTHSILNAQGGLTTGGTPATACGSATNCFGLNEAGTAGTPTVGQDYCRADSVAHAIVCSFNNGAEAAIPLATGGWLAPTSAPGASYNILTSDFSTSNTGLKVYHYSGIGATTWTLPNPAPTTNGQCLVALDYAGAGNLTIARNGLAINSGASNLTITASTSKTICSDGTNYYAY